MLLIKSLQPLLSCKILWTWRWSGEDFYTEQTQSGVHAPLALFIASLEGQEDDCGLLTVQRPDNAQVVTAG